MPRVGRGKKRLDKAGLSMHRQNMGCDCVISRFVWGWSLLGLPLEHCLWKSWSEFKKALEEFEHDFRDFF